MAHLWGSTNRSSLAFLTV